MAPDSISQSDSVATVKALSPSVVFIFMDGGTNKISELERGPYAEKFVT